MKHLIGAGHLAEKILRNSGPDHFFVYDNNPDLQGTDLHGHIVLPVDSIAERTEGEIIICTTSVSEIESQLQYLGVEMPVSVPAVLREFQSQANLLSLCPSFLIASGLPSNNLHGASGGLYKVEVNEDNVVKVSEIISGPCHAVVRDGTDYVASVQAEGLIILDDVFKAKRVIALPVGARPHGVAVTKEHYIVVASNFDALLKVNKKSHRIKQIPFSHKQESLGSAQHHGNDIEIIGEVAYISMFSVSGSWKNGLFDCGLLEINLETEEKNPLPLPIKLPHSVRAIDDTLIVLNSFDGSVYSFGALENYGFNGFLRGVDYDPDYFYFAESRNRNNTPLRRTSFPSSIDSKINIVCRSSNFSRTIVLPPDISEIHSILKLT